MRLYRLSNKARTGCWVFADDEQEARAIFLEDGRVRRPENITSVEDQTEFYRKTTDLDKVHVKGTASLCIPSIGGRELLLAISQGTVNPRSPHREWSVSRGGKLVRDPYFGIGMNS
jgi:hypothetical protein